MHIPEGPDPQEAWVKSLPAYALTQEQLGSLLEYSRSNPTGTTLGKIWKCNVATRTHEVARFTRYGVRDYATFPPLWIIREYVPCPAEAGGKACKVQGSHVHIRDYQPAVLQPPA